MEIRISTDGIDATLAKRVKDFNAEVSKLDAAFDEAEGLASSLANEADELTFAALQKRCADSTGKLFTAAKDRVKLAADRAELLGALAEAKRAAFEAAIASHQKLVESKTKKLRSAGLGAQDGDPQPEAAEQKLTVQVNSLPDIRQAAADIEAARNELDRVQSQADGAHGLETSARKQLREFVGRLAMASTTV